VLMMDILAWCGMYFVRHRIDDGHFGMARAVFCSSSS
jgi:hypothetical protein